MAETRQGNGQLHTRRMLRLAALAVLLAAVPGAAQECLNPALTYLPGNCRTYDDQPEQCEASYIIGGTGPTSCFVTPWGSCEGCGPNNEGTLCTNTCQPALECTGDPERTQFVGDSCYEFNNQPEQCNQAFGRLSGDTTTSCFSEHRCVPCGGDDDGPLAEFCVNSCVPRPDCFDQTRTIFTGGPGTRACRQFDGNEAACNQAYALSGEGVVSCVYFDGECLGCGPNNEGEICTNTCREPPRCPDPTRTIYTGGPYAEACRQFDGDEAACNQAYHLGLYGLASCFYDDEGDCRGCGPNNESAGRCTNTCFSAPECADPTRTLVGGPFSAGCQQFAGNQAECESAYVVGDNGRPNACYYDDENDSCRGCGPENEGNGKCTNTCVVPAPCADPSRTIYAGPPGSDGCYQFSDNPTGCAQAYVEGHNGVASCFLDPDTGSCRGCGPINENEGACTNTCVPPPSCPFDETRTIYAGGPDSAGCRQFDGNPEQCLQAFVRGHDGVASCFYDNGSCRGCGPYNSGACTNTCVPPPSCPLDGTRTIYAGGPGSAGCHQFDGNPEQCLQAFVVGQAGVASCFYDDGSCSGCGPANVNAGRCVNSCIEPPFCTADQERTQLGCRQFDGNPDGCATAFGVLDDGTPTSCVSAYACNLCDDDAMADGACTNACAVRPVPSPARAPTISWPGLVAVLLAFSVVAFRRLRRLV